MDDDFSWLGLFNDPPPNWERISEEEFWDKFGANLPEYSTIKQIYHWSIPKLEIDNPLKFYQMTLWVYRDRTGVGYIKNYSTTHSKYLKPNVFFSFFDCDHNMIGEEIGNCLTRYTCEKCGYKETIDSSG